MALRGKRESMQGSLRRSLFALAMAFAVAGALGQTTTAPDDPAGGKPAAGGAGRGPSRASGSRAGSGSHHSGQRHR